MTYLVTRRGRVAHSSPILARVGRWIPKTGPDPICGGDDALRSSRMLSESTMVASASFLWASHAGLWS